MANKIALVTGSNRGIGFTVVKQLLEKGFTTILTARDSADGKKATEKLIDKGDLHFHQLDVNDAESIAEIKQRILEKFGRLDVLINNAGINYDSEERASTVDLENVKHTIETNLFGPWRMCQAFVPLMKENGYGRIVNVSSGAGAMNEMSAGTPAYSTSKTALNVLTIKLAKELEGTGILVNSVCPGWVRTDMGGKEAPRSTDEGAEGIVWLAQLPEGGKTGKFFRDKEEIEF